MAKTTIFYTNFFTKKQQQMKKFIIFLASIFSAGLLIGQPYGITLEENEKDYLRFQIDLSKITDQPIQASSLAPSTTGSDDQKILWIEIQGGKDDFWVSLLDPKSWKYTYLNWQDRETFARTSSMYFYDFYHPERFEQAEQKLIDLFGEFYGYVSRLGYRHHHNLHPKKTKQVSKYIYYANGNILYKGETKGSIPPIPDGHGTVYFPSGEQITGNWQRGKLTTYKSGKQITYLVGGFPIRWLQLVFPDFVISEESSQFAWPDLLNSFQLFTGKEIIQDGSHARVTYWYENGEILFTGEKRVSSIGKSWQDDKVFDGTFYHRNGKRYLQGSFSYNGQLRKKQYFSGKVYDLSGNWRATF